MPNGKRATLAVDLGSSNTTADFEGVAVSTGYNQSILPSIARIEDGVWSVPEPGQRPSEWAHHLRFAKRLLGRTSNDGSLEADAKDVQHVVMIGGEAKYKVGAEYVKAIEVSAFLLGILRQRAAVQFDQPYRDAIISVPAYFSYNQKEATRLAAEISGFENVTVIEEPVAAAIEYMDQNPGKSAFYVLIVDIGGGTTDFTLVYIEKNKVVVKGTEGRSNMAGADLTRWLMKGAIGKWGGREEELDKENLEIECENQKVKMAMPSIQQISIPMRRTADGSKPQRVSFTRAEFDIICDPLWEVVRERCNSLFKSSGQKWDCLEAIVLTGGSCALPRVRQMCEEECPGVAFSTADPERCVARGLGVLTRRPEIKVIPVLPRSIGIESDPDGKNKEVKVDIMLARNTQLPAIAKKDFYTKEHQTVIEITLCEGEERDASRSAELGTFYVDVPNPGTVRVIEVVIRVPSPDRIIVEAYLKDQGKGNRRGKKTKKNKNKGGKLVVEHKQALASAEIEVLRQLTQLRLSGTPVGDTVDLGLDENHTTISEGHQSENTDADVSREEHVDNTSKALSARVGSENATTGRTESGPPTQSDLDKEAEVDAEGVGEPRVVNQTPSSRDKRGDGGENAAEEAARSDGSQANESTTLNNGTNSEKVNGDLQATQTNEEGHGNDAEGEPVDGYENVRSSDQNEQECRKRDTSVRAAQVARPDEEEEEETDGGGELQGPPSEITGEGRKQTMNGGPVDGNAGLKEQAGTKRGLPPQAVRNKLPKRLRQNPGVGHRTSKAVVPN